MRSNVKCAHEITCCHTCLKQWIDTGINSGQLYATCPDTSCRRKFTIADIRLIDRATADKLAATIKEAECAAAMTRLEDPGYDAWATAAQAKHCPHCHAAIEKNGGCDHMVCWRCGNDFQWKRAKSVSSRPAVSSQPNGLPVVAVALEAPRAQQILSPDVFDLLWDDAPPQSMLPEAAPTGLQVDLEADIMFNTMMTDVASQPATTTHAQQETTSIISGNQDHDDLLEWILTLDENNRRV